MPHERADGVNNKERIAVYLKKRKSQSYCDDCLSDLMNIRPRQQVQQKTSALAREGGFRRKKNHCHRCQKIKLVIHARW